MRRVGTQLNTVLKTEINVFFRLIDSFKNIIKSISYGFMICNKLHAGNEGLQ